MRDFIKRRLPWLYKARWFLAGVAAFLVVWVLSCSVNLTHSTSPENYYSIAWTYITLAIGITSLLYPLALTIRDSLTGRLFVAYDKLLARKGHEAGLDDPEIQSFIKDSFEPLQRFRTVLFDIQLPILAVFSLLSVIRTLLCLVQIGPFPVKQQMIEPQFYMLGYVAWLIWVAGGILTLRPYYAIEKAETEILGLPMFEQSFAQELADKSAARAGGEPRE